MKHRSGTLVLAAAVAAGCGPGRTTAATQPTPVAFDAAKSEPKAVELADAVVANLGGGPAWDAVKQLSWDLKYSLDGQIKGWFRHAWDRWNGRHHFESIALETGELAFQAMYDIFDPDDRGWVGDHDGNAAMAAERDDKVRIARDRLTVDGYQLTIVHKLKDPGVILTLAGQASDLNGFCKPTCETLKVTFDPAVGTDTYYVEVNSVSKMPEVIERPQGAGRIGFSLESWTTVGGVKFPTKMQNLGMPGEIFLIEDLEVGEPDDALYVVPVR